MQYQIPSYTELPSTCIVAEIATVGQDTYVCMPTNTWNRQQSSQPQPCPAAPNYQPQLSIILACVIFLALNRLIDVIRLSVREMRGGR
jgi:hypothetical protein